MMQCHLRHSYEIIFSGYTLSIQYLHLSQSHNGFEMGFSTPEPSMKQL